MFGSEKRLDLVKQCLYHFVWCPQRSKTTHCIVSSSFAASVILLHCNVILRRESSLWVARSQDKRSAVWGYRDSTSPRSVAVMNRPLKIQLLESLLVTGLVRRAGRHCGAGSQWMLETLLQRAEALAFIKCKNANVLRLVSESRFAFYATPPLQFVSGRAGGF